MSEIRTDTINNASGDNDSGIDLSTNDQVSIKTANTTALTVDASQNVGIGVSPNVKLHIKADDPKIFLEDTSPDDARGASIHSAAGDLFLRTGDNLDTGSPTVNSEIVLTDGNNIVFKNNASTERMRIDSSGNLKVATTLTPAQLVDGTSGEGLGYQAGDFLGICRDGGAVMHLNRLTSTGEIVTFRKDATNVGNISVTASATSYNTSSDHRLKENVTADWDATTRLKQLNPVRFNFIADADTTVDGFLAHEVQSVVPEAITGTHNEVDDDGNPVYQGIDQSKLVPLLVKTIQELEARITALENA